MSRSSGSVPAREAERLGGALAADDSLEHAAQLMTEHKVSHLLVVQPDTGDPLGVVSTLNLARVLAWDPSS